MIQESLNTAERIIEAIKQLGSREKAEQLQRFFKTGPGGYGEGDIFIGAAMPDLHRIAKRAAKQIDLAEVPKLIRSEIHENRMTGLLILVYMAGRSGGRYGLEQCAAVYLENLDHVNNWDLVDVTCPKILGPWFFTRDRSPLVKLAQSDSLWHQRIAMLTTLHFIRSDDYATTFRLAEILQNNSHDLIHKAVGWMLREVGNRNPLAERDFLRERYHMMPRTMLRYAIEKFPEDERRRYLRGEI